MPQKPPDFQTLIRLLNAEKVSFVVVGGMAMVLHGSDHMTIDCDFAVATGPENKEPLVRAFSPLSPRPSHLANFKDFPWDSRSIFGNVISLVTDAGDVDLLRVLPGIDSFESLLARSETRIVFGEPIQVACLEDLIEMKKAAGRPKDLVHLIELESLLSIRDLSE